jgi:hypothetical protein
VDGLGFLGMGWGFWTRYELVWVFIVRSSLLGHKVKVILTFLAMGLGFLDSEWTCLSFFGEVPCFLNIWSMQLG